MGTGEAISSGCLHLSNISRHAGFDRAVYVGRFGRRSDLFWFTGDRRNKTYHGVFHIIMSVIPVLTVLIM